jgi:predicted TIM-barrel fold metal-dependent hydrolase
LVDVHAHFVTERYVAAATAAGHEHPDGMPGWPQWSTAAHLDLMDRGQIQTSILSVSSPGTHFGDDRAARTLSREVNEFAARLRAAHPARFGRFASLPLPDIDGALYEIEYALETLNADGFALESNHRGAYLGDDRYEPVWAELDRRRAMVFVHPTSPPNATAVSLGRPRPMLEFLFDSARAASDLVFTGTLLRYPRIQWIFSHGGGVPTLLVDRMELFRGTLPSNGFDPAATASVADQLRMLWFDMAGTWRELTTPNAQRLLRLPVASPTTDRA